MKLSKKLLAIYSSIAEEIYSINVEYLLKKMIDCLIEVMPGPAYNKSKKGNKMYYCNLFKLKKSVNQAQVEMEDFTLMIYSKSKWGK